MRDQLRDMIAARMHTVDCGCPDWTPDAPDATDFYRQLADAVMDLFPDVERQGRRTVAFTAETPRDPS